MKSNTIKTKKVLRLSDNWTTSSWKNFPISQNPKWPIGKLNKTIDIINSYPPLVPIHEIEQLKEQFNKVSNKSAFILIAGDCAETFEDFKHESIQKKLEIIFHMSVILGYGIQKPIIKIARIAGQFAKPRSSKYEINGNVSLPSYMGDAVNSKRFNLKDRTPNPKRLIRSYNQSAATLNSLRSLTKKNIYDMIKGLDKNINQTSKSKDQSKMIAIKKAINFSQSINNQKMYSHIFSKDFFTAHEALLLDYEQALTRRNSENNLWYDCSSHMVWLGYRTGQPDYAHVEFLSGIQNPIGIKVGPKSDNYDIIEIINKLNPSNEKGKIILVLRYGLNKIEKQLGELIQKITDSKLNVLWMCDPMHGNTFLTDEGFKTRDFNDIIKELKCFFKILKSNKIAPSGVHFELTHENVTECISESYNIKQSNIHTKYETACDPRLNKNQSIDISFLITKLIKDNYE